MKARVARMTALFLVVAVTAWLLQTMEFVQPRF